MGPDLTVMIGGEAGDGIRQAGLLMDKTFVRGGFHVFSVFDYQSLIRGGHNYHLVRVSVRPVRAPRRWVDLLIALNEDTIERHAGELTTGSALLYDSDSVKDLEVVGPAKPLPMPLRTMAREVGGPLIVRNSAALGAMVYLL
ncbi:MAG: 2-oxoacid:acceptor oxidoreductase family protein, partial [Candidatus Korarchaeota archaeon]|nr:2-oxoacid:acceptor oxidoreductase family protein [Candidatus Korarchaeota archaeon]